jgi:hypothetical protein
MMDLIEMGPCSWADRTNNFIFTFLPETILKDGKLQKKKMGALIFQLHFH